MNIRHAAVPALILVGGAFLAGCGDTTDDGGTAPETNMDSTMLPDTDTSLPTDG